MATQGKITRQEALADSRPEKGKRVHVPCGKVIWPANPNHTCGRHLGRPRKVDSPSPLQAKSAAPIPPAPGAVAPDVVEHGTVGPLIITVDPSIAVDVDAEMAKLMGQGAYEKADRDEGEKQLEKDARRVAKRKRTVLLSDVLPKGGQMVWHHIHKFEEHLVNWVAGTRKTNDALNFMDGPEGKTLDEMANIAFPLDLDIKLAYILTNVSIFGGYIVIHLDTMAGRFSGWMARRDDRRIARAAKKAALAKLTEQEAK